MVKQTAVFVVGAIAGVLVAAVGVVWADAEQNSCPVAIGRYQVAAAATASGRDDVYETVIDTCTGTIVSRTETSVGRFKKSPKLPNE
jgi:hypothetical protein